MTDITHLSDARNREHHKCRMMWGSVWHATHESLIAEDILARRLEDDAVSVPQDQAGNKGRATKRCAACVRARKGYCGTPAAIPGCQRRAAAGEGPHACCADTMCKTEMYYMRGLRI